MRVRLSAAARRDLSDIWTYSTKRWDNAQADGSVQLFADSFDDLARGRLKGRSVDDIRAGYFKLAVGSHFIFYRTGAVGVFEVVRILHRRMNVIQHL